ncbi:hypothetical protein HUJ04_011203 [Dendroctonus ponderosae]|nr:hypothetical protein HUJ04_011203 [Dendroctonus ponderosae]
MSTHNNTRGADEIIGNYLENPEKAILDQLLRKCDEKFSDGPEKLKRPPATMHFKPGTPVFARAREIPQALYLLYII